MTPEELIRIFKHTQRMIAESPVLRERTIRAQSASQLYLEGYSSAHRPVKGPLSVEIHETTTFQCAADTLTPGQRTAVLNFANPHEPGGGVFRGAMAQEECLCRCSTLYNTLLQPYFQKHYYEYHSRNCDYSFSDRLIYSPGVVVFKSDDLYPQVLSTPFTLDVITCAAPLLTGSAQWTLQELLEIYRSRIRNILESAMANNVDILILGAFGCGAFHNDPSLMSRAFHDLLIREHYAQHFRRVIFAIKRSSGYNRNLLAFRETFSPPSSHHPQQ